LEQATVLIEGMLAPALAEMGLRIVPVYALDNVQIDSLHDYFLRQVYPLLIPLAVDPGRPFPYISSDSLNLLVELRAAGESPTLFARVKVPRVTPRLIGVPQKQPARRTHGDGCPAQTCGPLLYVWSADLVRHFIHDLFAGMPVKDVHLFRVLRAQECERQNGVGHRAARRNDEQPVVRLDVAATMPDNVLMWLMHHLRVQANAVVQLSRPLETLCLHNLAELAARVPEMPAATSK
jgi:polyphosphate kinase